jgi:hypothetical protein
MPSAPDEGQSLAELSHVAVPELYGRIGAHDPAFVGRMQVDRAVEPMGPLHHRRVVVGMGDRDRLEAAEPLDRLDRRLVQQRDAVPQQATAAEGDDQRALADRELRCGSDSDKLVLGANLIHMVASEILERRPLLPGLRNPLPRIGADRAHGRGWARVGELRSACGADRAGQAVPPEPQCR